MEETQDALETEQNNQKIQRLAQAKEPPALSGQLGVFLRFTFQVHRAFRNVDDLAGQLQAPQKVTS